MAHILKEYEKQQEEIAHLKDFVARNLVRASTAKSALDRVKKLERLASTSQAKQLHRQVYVDRRVKTMNESIYYTVDKLHSALAAGRSVTFKYFEYNLRKEKVFRRDGKRYAVLPYGLIWDNENYYLAGYDLNRKEVRHYRVDKMSDLAVVCLKAEDAPRPDQFDVADYAGKHFGMFSGREGQVRLRCENRMVGVILDRFGLDVMLIPDGDGHFTVTADVVVSPQFFAWVCGFGAQVRILSPASVVEQMETHIRSILAQYQ